MKTIFLLISVFLAINSATAIDSNQASNASTKEHNDMKATITGNRDFSFALYKGLKENPTMMSPKGNIFFSPYSVSSCFAMTYGGAREDTQRQMAMALHFKLSSDWLAQTLGSLQKQFIDEDKSRDNQILIANALWGKKGGPFLKEFLDLLKYYKANCNQLDFVNEPEQSRGKINSWVEDKTKNKIKDLIPLGGIDQDTSLVLTNAIYFKGEWSIKFSRWKTEKADFTISANHKVKIQLMHQKEHFKYFEDANMQAIELPYKSKEFSMLVILPRDAEGIKVIEKSFTSENLDDLLLKISTTEVDVYFPKFKITWGSFSLKNILMVLGMTDAFIPEKADFSGINGNKEMWISDVFQKAFIEVDEKGTEAAAATADVMTLSVDSEPPVFRADHPFIFIIKDNRSGSILFMGRVMDPSE